MFPSQVLPYGSIYSMDVHDLNGDGNDDLIFPIRSGNNGVLRVLMGNADGSFASPLDYAAGSYSATSASIDFDRDGDLDILLVDMVQKNARVMENVGDGVFASLTTVSVPASINQIQVGDFNDDGLPDLVVADGTTANLWFLYHTGHNANPFDAAVAYPLSRTPSRVSVANLDGLRGDDLVLGNSGGFVHTLLHAGGTAFSAGAVPAEPASVVVGDLDLDGLSDLVFFSSSDQSVSRAINDGTGGFMPAEPAGTLSLDFSYSTPFVLPPLSTLRLRDLNGDGYLDLIGLPFFSRIGNPPFTGLERCVVRMSDSTGNWGDAQLFHAPGATVDLIRSETADGDARLVAVSLSRLALFNVTDTRIEAAAANYGHTEFDALADFNGDGYLDLAVASEVEDGKLRIAYGDEHGHFRADWRAPGLSVPPVDRVYAGDFNGDGHQDILGTGYFTTWVAISQGDGTFTSVILLPDVRGDDLGNAVADMNNDGLDDFVADHYNVLSVFLSNGDGTFTEVFSQPSPQMVNLELVDLNGDGLKDIVCAGGPRGIWISLNLGGGAFTTWQLLGASVNPARVGDIDGDGDLDIVRILGNGSRRISVFFNDGHANFTEVNDPNWPLGSRLFSLGDVNGDGKADVVTFIPGNNWIDIYLSNGDGTFTYASRHLAFSAGRVDIRDFNGDGNSDLLVLLSRATYLAYGPAVVLFNRSAAPDIMPPQLLNAALEPAQLDLAATFEFDEPIDPASINLADLVIENLSTGTTAAALAYAMSHNDKRITFSLLSSMPDGNYRFTLTGIRDVAGNSMGAPAVLSGPDVYLLAGDANRDRKVDFDDLLILAQNYGQAGRTVSQGNFNRSADGSVDFDDLLILAQRYGTTLAAIIAPIEPAKPVSAAKKREPRALDWI